MGSAELRPEADGNLPLGWHLGWLLPFIPKKNRNLLHWCRFPSTPTWKENPPRWVGCSHSSPERNES